MKMLRVLHQAETVKERGKILPDIVSTYLAAHAVPAGKTSKEATNDIVKNQVGKSWKKTIFTELIFFSKFYSRFHNWNY